MRCRRKSGFKVLLAASILHASLSCYADFPNKSITGSENSSVEHLQFYDQEVQFSANLTSGESVEFTVKDGLRSVTIVHPAQFIDEIRQVVRYKNSLVVVSGIGQYDNFTNFTVISLTALTVKASFNAYSAALSPDGSKVAFVRFYPLHFTAASEDQYYVASFDEILGTRALNSDMRRDTTDPFEAAGTQILTEASERRGRSNVGVSDGGEHRMLSSFVWSADSTVLGFVDGIGRNVAHLVVVSFAGAKPDVRRYPIRAALHGDKFEVDLEAPAGPALVQVQRQQGAMASKRLINLGAPETVPQ